MWHDIEFEVLPAGMMKQCSLVLFLIYNKCKACKIYKSYHLFDNHYILFFLHFSQRMWVFNLIYICILETSHNIYQFSAFSILTYIWFMNNKNIITLVHFHSISICLHLKYETYKHMVETFSHSLRWNLIIVNQITLILLCHKC